MVEYWAKSDDPVLKEKAEKAKQDRLEQLKKQEQTKLDEELKQYWKKQKVEEGGEETAEKKETAPATTKAWFVFSSKFQVFL